MLLVCRNDCIFSRNRIRKFPSGLGRRHQHRCQHCVQAFISVDKPQGLEHSVTRRRTVRLLQSRHAVDESAVSTVYEASHRPNGCKKFTKNKFKDIITLAVCVCTINVLETASSRISTTREPNRCCISLKISFPNHVLSNTS